MDAGLDIPRYYERYRLRRPIERWRRRRAPDRAGVPAPRVETPDPAPAHAATPTALAPMPPLEAEPPRRAHTEPVEPEDDAPECRCGFHVGHPFIRPHCEFTGTGWILITIGINAPPRAVRLQCAHCGDVLERITDPQRLRDMQW